MKSMRKAVIAAIVIGIGFLGNAFGQESWTVKSPIPNLKNVIWAGTQFVAVGDSGAIFTSANGTGWTRKNSGTTKSLRSAAWTGSKIVVVGDGVVTTSSDGTGWTATMVVDAAKFYSITWTRSLFIAFGYGSIFSSPDGMIWTKRYSEKYGSGSSAAIAFSNAMIVAAGEAGLTTSSDGVSWTKRDSINSYSSVIWTGTKFVATGYNSISTSSDGITWSRKNGIFGTSESNNMVLAWTGNQIISCGSAYNTDGIFTSPDAINWTMRKAPIPYQSYISSIASSPSGQIVAVGGGTILTSSDGITWISRTSGISGYITSITRTFDKWMGASGYDIISSTDASGWSIASGSINSKFIVWTGSQLILISGMASNSPNGIYTSPDGINWKQCIANISGLNGVTAGTNQIVTVGSQGKVLTSTDGNTWIYRNSGTYCILNAITWTGTQFVAVGASGIIITSPDGISWTRRYVNQINNLSSILWTGSQLVAVGDRTIITSPDAITWTKQYSNDSSILCGIAGTSTRMAAVGSNYSYDPNTGNSTNTGLILSSRDGITWTPRSSGTTYPLRAIACADSQFVAVGDNGTVLVSPLSTGTTSPLAKSTAPVFIPQLNRQGITVELGAGQYTLSIIDMAGRTLYNSSGIAGTAVRRTFTPAISTNCCIIKLNQNGMARATKVMMVN